jgi:sugar lactone lactonase YvrE
VGEGAALNTPRGVALSPDARFLYFADSGNDRVRRVRLCDSKVETVAGCGERASRDGPLLSASFAFPYGLAWDHSSDTLLVSEWEGNRIRRICLRTDRVTTVAGCGERGWRDGAGALAKFNEPCFLCVDALGTILVADSRNAAVRRITFPHGPPPSETRGLVRERAHVSTIVGNGHRGLGFVPVATLPHEGASPGEDRREDQVNRDPPRT